MVTAVRSALDAKIQTHARPGPLGVQSRNQFLAGMPNQSDEDVVMDAGYEDDPAMDKKMKGMSMPGQPS